jgi:hypothetical protein
MRLSRMMGYPPNISGFAVMRDKSSALILSYSFQSLLRNAPTRHPALHLREPTTRFG